MFSADLPPIAGPDVEYALIAPILIITAAAVIGTLVEAVVPRGPRFVVQALVAVVGVLAALVDTVVVYSSPGAVCIEPWSAWPDALRISATHPTGLAVLEPGESLGRWTRWSWARDRRAAWPRAPASPGRARSLRSPRSPAYSRPAPLARPGLCRAGPARRRDCR